MYVYTKGPLGSANDANLLQLIESIPNMLDCSLGRGHARCTVISPVRLNYAAQRDPITVSVGITEPFRGGQISSQIARQAGKQAGRQASS